MKATNDERELENEQFKQTWNQDPKLRNEFMNDFAAYAAWARADAKGRIRMHGSRVQRV